MKKFKPFRTFLLSAPVVFFSMQTSLALSSEETAISNGKWYERSFEQLLKTEIITATRNQKNIDQSPSNISVYTAADIKRMGIRNIKELLQRTPGFFINGQLAGPAIGSRGFIGDNEQFLLLIDGHSANSIVDKGAGNFFLFPFLEHIERVEIQRGPGSTLWGSDAALGIIHIITKNGKGLEGVAATYSLASEDNYQYLNLRAGKDIAENVNYMFSFTTANSKGFKNEQMASAAKEGMWEKIDDSYELYFKGQLDDITIYARSADMRNTRPGGSIALNELNHHVNPATQVPDDPVQYAVYTRMLNDEAFTRRQHNYIDIEHQKQFSRTFKLETRFYTDLIQGYQAQINPVISNGVSDVEESAGNKENALGLEIMGKWQANAFHNVLLGLRAVKTEVDPVSNAVLYPSSSGSSSSFTLRSMRTVPKSLDKNVAVFIEDDWIINDAFNAIYGVRVDKNTLREDNTIIMPSLSLNWKIDPNWSSQYSYSTGYIRPPVGIGFLGQAQYNTNLSTASGKLFGADKSEEVFNHNIRLSYNNDPVSIKLNLYHTTIDNSFDFIYEPDATYDSILFYVNANKIETYGSELEFNYVPSEIWNLYGNFSYVIDSKMDDLTGSAHGINYDMNHSTFGFSEGSFTPDGTIVGYPHNMWNLGINFFFSNQISTNLHYRGWKSLPSRNRIDLFTVGTGQRSYGPENFVDINVRYENIANTRLDIALFVKNLLNNDDSKIGMLYFTREWSDLGRSAGFDISYKF